MNYPESNFYVFNILPGENTVSIKEDNKIVDFETCQLNLISDYENSPYLWIVIIEINKKRNKEEGNQKIYEFCNRYCMCDDDKVKNDDDDDNEEEEEEDMGLEDSNSGDDDEDDKVIPIKEQIVRIGSSVVLRRMNWNTKKMVEIVINCTELNEFLEENLENLHFKNLM